MQANRTELALLKDQLSKLKQASEKSHRHNKNSASQEPYTAQHAAPTDNIQYINTNGMLTEDGKLSESNKELQMHNNLLPQEINIVGKDSGLQGAQNPEVKRLIKERQGLMDLGVYSSSDEIIQAIDKKLDELTRGSTKSIITD